MSYVLDGLVDRREEAILRLRNAAPDFVDRVIQDADVDQSLEVLDRIEVAAKRERAGLGAVAVQVNIGMPGLVVGSDPVVEGESVDFDVSSPDLMGLSG